MNQHPTTTSRFHRAGFTLAEILLAMLVFAIAITTILALLARSVETAQEILTKDEAIGLSSAVEDYMTGMPFLEAYGLTRVGTPLFAYSYRGDPTRTRQDGTLGPITTPTGGDVVTGVRYDSDPFLDADVAALEGRMFRVRLQVSNANPIPAGEFFNISNPDAVSGGVPAYNSAVLVVYAEFYPVPTTGFVPASTVQPVFSFNFAVRR